MSIAVRIPASLRDYCGEMGDIHLSAHTLRSALEQLEKNHPSLYRSVCDETGAVRRHVNLFVNSNYVPVRDANGLDMQLNSGDELTIWTAVSGG